MTPTYEKDGKWYCYGVGGQPDVGPFSTEADAFTCHEAMTDLLFAEASNL